MLFATQMSAKTIISQTFYDLITVNLMYLISAKCLKKMPESKPIIEYTQATEKEESMMVLFT